MTDEAVLNQRLLRVYDLQPAACVERDVRVQAIIDPEAVTEVVRQLGGRVYASNQPAEQLSLYSSRS